MIIKFSEFINEETKLFGKSTVWDEDKQKSVDPHKWSWDKKRKEVFCSKCGSVRIKHGWPHHFYYDYITPTGEDSTNIPFCVSKEKHQYDPYKGRIVNTDWESLDPRNYGFTEGGVLNSH